MQTFGELRSEVLAWLDESNASEGDPTFVNVENALRQAHTIRLTEDKWPFMLWPKVETFSTSAGTQTYALHQAFHRPVFFRNTTQGYWLTETPPRNLQDANVDEFTDTGTGRFTLWHRQPVQAQPASASVITIVSSSALDTGSSKGVVVYGDTASGLREETITPTGTTPASGSVSFTQIISVTKLAEWSGTLSVTAGATSILTLFGDEFGRSYPTIQLLYSPTGTETISYRFYRAPKELTRSNDLTDIPPPFERVLVFDALLLLAAYDNRLDGGRGELWASLRSDLDFQLRQSAAGGQTVNAEPKFVRNYSREALVGG